MRARDLDVNMHAWPSVRAALRRGVMAGAEVTVSPGHLMAVKEEEAGGSSGNNHKAQVILHLQPILHG